MGSLLVSVPHPSVVRLSRGSDKEFARRTKLIARKNDMEGDNANMTFAKLLVLVASPLPVTRSLFSSSVLSTSRMDVINANLQRKEGEAVSAKSR